MNNIVINVDINERNFVDYKRAEFHAGLAQENLI